MPTYAVLVSDNFHNMDESEQYKHGDFDTCEAALAACKQIIDDFLLSSLPSPYDLWTLYTTFGDYPVIVPRDPNCPFSAWEYAKQRCQELTPSNG